MDTGVGLRVESGCATPTIFGAIRSEPIPYQVGLWDRERHSLFCGGSIISPLFILTAAHCMVDQDNTRRSPTSFIVAAGDYDISISEGTEQYGRVEEIYVHEDYNRKSALDSDVALIKLEKPLQFNKNVSQIGIPVTKRRFSGIMRVSGWGATKDNRKDPSKTKRPLQLQETNLYIIDNGECQKRLEKIDYPIPMPHVTEGMLCGHSAAASACRGDSGGPVVCKNRPRKKGNNDRNYVAKPSGAIGGCQDEEPWDEILCGVVSWGPVSNCNSLARKQGPAVFVDVSNYASWIQTMMHGEDNPTPPTDNGKSGAVICADSGNKIPAPFVCDGERDCMDGTDERNCPRGKVPASEEEEEVRVPPARRTRPTPISEEEEEVRVPPARRTRPRPISEEEEEVRVPPARRTQPTLPEPRSNLVGTLCVALGGLVCPGEETCIFVHQVCDGKVDCLLSGVDESLNSCRQKFGRR